MLKLTRIIALVMAFIAPAMVNAVDGVIEINQAKVLVGSITPSDPPGFPIVIDTGGSYRLTGDLTVTNGSTAVQFEGANITLDLNGFTVQGPAVCTGEGAAVVCSGAAGPGIQFTGDMNATVMKGTIRGFNNALTVATSASRIQLRDLQILRNDNDGVELHLATSVHLLRVRSWANEGFGFRLGGTTTLADCEGSSNKEDGVFFGETTCVGSSIRDSIFSSNGRHGVFFESSCDGFLVTGSLATENQSIGMASLPGALSIGLATNVLTGNGSSDLNIPSFVALGENVCGDDTTCP